MGAQAIHPGYGFLAENADFAARCAESGLVFVGPSPEAMRRMGDKAAAREAATRAGVPVAEGSAVLAGFAEARARLLRDRVSAAHQGRRRRWRHGDAPGARAGPPRTLLRRGQFRGRIGVRGPAGCSSSATSTAPRHVEVQVFGDDFGAVVHLGERDCSIQRRNQKLIEESPSPAVGPELGAKMSAAAVRLARAAEYRNAGTVEFLLDSRGSVLLSGDERPAPGPSTPVTEQVTGLDPRAAAAPGGCR